MMRPLNLHRGLGALGLAAWLAIIACLAQAHEVRPALLQLTERGDGRFDVLWKEPASGGAVLRLNPEISGGLLERSPDRILLRDDSRTSVWFAVALGDEATVRIKGLGDTITSVLLLVRRTKGEETQRVLRPHEDNVVLQVRKRGAAVSAYFGMGVEHIWTGADHLAFVLGLVLLAKGYGAMFKAVTAFTVGHSITLAAATLNLIAVEATRIEVFVALSVVYIYVELAHQWRWERSAMAVNPWPFAFAFGLLHGTAFAGALAEIGLPPEAVPQALFSFNAGVEFGQLIFIALAICIGSALRRVGGIRPRPARWAVPYVSGSFAAAWLCECLYLAAARGTI